MPDAQHAISLLRARADENNFTLGFRLDRAHKTLQVVRYTSECDELTRVTLPAIDLLVHRLPLTELSDGGWHGTTRVFLNLVLTALDAVACTDFELFQVIEKVHVSHEDR